MEISERARRAAEECGEYTCSEYGYDSWLKLEPAAEIIQRAIDEAGRERDERIALLEKQLQQADKALEGMI